MIVSLFHRYIEVAKRVPFGQSAVIWQIFCDEIKQNYLQTAKSSPSEENQEACGLDAALCGSLEHVAVLFSVFLLNTSLGSAADHRKTKATLDAICRLHDQTVTEVLVPLTGAAPRLESSKVLHVLFICRPDFMYQLESYLQ